MTKRQTCHRNPDIIASYGANTVDWTTLKAEAATKNQTKL
jgi:hypothetical protein